MAVVVDVELDGYSVGGYSMVVMRVLKGGELLFRFPGYSSAAAFKVMQHLCRRYWLEVADMPCPFVVKLEFDEESWGKCYDALKVIKAARRRYGVMRRIVKGEISMEDILGGKLKARLLIDSLKR